MLPTALIRRMATAATRINYAEYLTESALRRKPSPIRALQPLVSLPGMISLGGGMPNLGLFPVKGVSFTFGDGATVALSTADCAEALQYSATAGLPELVSRIQRLQQAEHAPPAPVDVMITPGSQDGLGKLFDALVGKDDTLIVEAPTYSGTLAYLDGIGCKTVGVATDGEGLVPEALESMLDGWDATKQGKKPRVLYTIPTGSNPTGATIPIARRHRIYDIARKHGLLIVEDDPYYYLSFSDKPVPSFLSMDVDGRVIRTDSFSKILSAGLRLGVVTGPKAILDKINLHNQASILHTSGVSQMVALALFRHWKVGEPTGTATTSTAAAAGGAGAVTTGGGGASASSATTASTSAAATPSVMGALADHLAAVRSFYTAQCDAFVSSANRHLRTNADGTGDLLVEFSRPSAGMFVWMRVLPVAKVDDTMELITKKAVDKKVLMVPGSAFYVGNPKTSFVRAAFSVASPEHMDTALQRFGELLRDCAKA